MNFTTILFLCLIGLCWGSFLNVVITRTLSGESIIYPPSKCPKCEHRLFWWHNIPLVSFLILGGKCYFCNKTISIRYPLIEIAGMIITLFAFIKNISVFDAISVILILSMYLVLSYTDIKEQKINVKQAFVVALGGIIYSRYDIFGSIVGGLAGSLLILSFIMLGEKLFNKRTFGFGDIWLTGALGAVVGIERLPLYLLYVVLIQFLLVLPKYVKNLIKSEQLETLKYLILFCVACLFLYVLRNVSFYGSKVILTAVLGVVVFMAYKSAKNILNTIQLQETPSYCPLAPAIAVSCLMFLC